MKYFLEFLHGSKEVQREVINPQFIRDAHQGETVILNTFFPDLFDTRTYMTIRSIEIEAGKRLYKLSREYGTARVKLNNKEKEKENE